MKGFGLFLIVSIAFLITGNLIGAGILGLPVSTGVSGFIPSLMSMVIFGGAMFYSAIALSMEAVETKEDTFNYPSLYKKYLGGIGKWAAIGANMLILYGLLTAYLTGATTIVIKLLKLGHLSALVLVVIFLIFTVASIMDIEIIKKYNLIMVVLMWASFAVIVLMGERHVVPERLEYIDWQYAPIAVPIILTSFHFHNIIPNICQNMKWDMRKIFMAILAGMVIGYIMNAVWIQVGIGAVPLEGGKNSIVYAYEHNLPVTVPMSKIIHSATFKTCAMLFALMAIITSYITNGIGLMGFNRDLVGNIFKVKSGKLAVILLTFIPPLIIAFFFPNIFLKAIDLVGGIGIVVLFGILPSIIMLLKKNVSQGFKILSFVMLLLFTAVFLWQIAEETGLVDIQIDSTHVADKMKQHLEREQ
jgi:tyrosine-specific transport protein